MAKVKPIINNRLARRIFMDKQGLCLPPAKAQSKTQLKSLIHQLGFVQLDSIRTVERAHHMILFARNQNYDREHLRQLHEDDSQLFEHWTHDAAVIPTEFYPHWKRRFELAEIRLRERWRKLRPTTTTGGKKISFEDMMTHVHQHIETNGPSLSRDFKAPPNNKKAGSSGWWEWHPSKTALEFLWRTGNLSIARRDGFQKVYDLTHRVIPSKHLHQKTQQEKAFIEWSCNNALDRLGFATSGELAAYWDSIKAAEAKNWCDHNQSKQLIEVLVEDAEGGTRAALARPSLLEQLDDLPEVPDRIRILSPFDPLLRDRKRLQRLFGFDYRIEIFVPEAKRKYGYYVFPVMEKDKMIGRIDMKTERQLNVLHVKGLWLEPGTRYSKSRQQRLAAELRRQAKFTGVSKLSFEKNYLKTP
ncbi:MAG: crosslink repair DNA glycosylase YcaQ family protein [Oceanicoccus sp.]